MSSFTTLKANIERDLLAPKPPKAPPTPTCFQCGWGFTPAASKADNKRFCSNKCEEAFDHGLPPYNANYVRDIASVPLDQWRVFAGPPGVEIGRQYYAGIINRPHRRRRGRTVPADELIRPRRPCERCGEPLPVWNKGRLVPASRKLCDRCRPVPLPKKARIAVNTPEKCP